MFRLTRQEHHFQTHLVPKVNRITIVKFSAGDWIINQGTDRKKERVLYLIAQHAAMLLYGRRALNTYHADFNTYIPKMKLT